MDKTANPYDNAQVLARSIVNHEVFTRYRDAKTRMEAQADLADRLARLRMLQERFSQAGKPVPEEEVQIIHREFAEIENRSEIIDFINAEGQLMRLVNDVQEIIRKEINRHL